MNAGLARVCHREPPAGRSSSVRVSLSLLVPLLLALLPEGASAEDTGPLRSRLEPLRSQQRVLPAEFAAVHAEFRAFIERRLGAGDTIAEMNAGLQRAGLLPPEEPGEETDKNYTGFLDPIRLIDFEGAGDLLVLRFGIHTGAGCSVDETLQIYRRKPLRLLGWVNAEPFRGVGSYLSAISMGKPTDVGRRLIGTGWFVSSCNSTYTTAMLRLDDIAAGSLRNLLRHGAPARRGFESPDIRIVLNDSSVVFRYVASMADGELLHRAAVAFFEVRGGRAVRRTPIALTRGGFLEEWLTLAATDTARFSTPRAASMQRAAASSLNRRAYRWTSAAWCPGGRRTLEIGIQAHETTDNYFFLIGGETASQLKMLSVSRQRDASCDAVDIGSGLAAVAEELPW